MNVTKTTTGKRSAPWKRVRAWLMLVLGLGLMWMVAYVILPWGQTLPHVGPVMANIAEANIDAGTYWYTQSEETARAQMFVRNAIRKHE